MYISFYKCSFRFSGVKRLCRDIEFMLNIKPGLYWRLCWGIFAPALMITILIYTFITYEPLRYRDMIYPNWAYGKVLIHFSISF